ncbi:MAG: hypothetical protein ACK5TC_00035, partial [bacterium]
AYDHTKTARLHDGHTRETMDTVVVAVTPTRVVQIGIIDAICAVSICRNQVVLPVFFRNTKSRLFSLTRYEAKRTTIQFYSEHSSRKKCGLSERFRAI